MWHSENTIMHYLGTVSLLALLGASLLSEAFSLATINQKSHHGQPNIPQAIDFGKFVEKYNKFYRPVESLSKWKIFLTRTLEIFKHNVQFVNKGVKYFLKQSEFIDMTPEEIRRTFVSRDVDFKPVNEAAKWPNRPADEIIYQLEADKTQSRPDSNDIENKSQETNLPRVNLFDEPELEVDKELAAEVDQITDRLASELITNRKLGVNEASITHQAQRAEGIRQVSFVEANNQNFDPSRIMKSYGIMDNISPLADSFSRYMMDDMNSNVYDHPFSDSLELEEEQIPSSFLDSLRSISGKLMRGSSFFGRDEATNTQATSPEDSRPSGRRPQDTATSSGVENLQLAPDMIGKPVYTIDWRQTGCISAPKSQGRCNSCYVFAVLDLMEFFYCRQKSEKVQFSVQYVLDCGSKFNISGCDEGKTANVGRFIIERGIHLEAYLPYKAQPDQCPYSEEEFASGSPYPIKPKLTHWRMFNELADWYRWLPRMPLIVGINMPADFLAYGGGIHDGSNCLAGLVHAMLLVGTGVQDGRKFWLLKNTFSHSWGESGYFKLAQSAPVNCFNSAVVARAQFNVVVVQAHQAP